MRQRPGKRRSFRQMINCDLELRPLMNVFIVLIPMLLMSAVFMEIRVIEMTFPEAALASEPHTPAFDLAIRIRPEAYVIEGDGATLAVITRVETRSRALPVAEAAAQIGQALAAAVAAHPDNKEVRIVAEAGTRYREIVGVMD